VISIFIPPLRERKKDLPLLAHYFLNRAIRKTGRNIEGFSDQAMKTLVEYDFPGNVRELENIVEHGFALAQGPLIGLSHLPGQLSSAGEGQDGVESLQDCERRILLDALRKNDFNRLAAARSLGMHKSTFFRKIRKLGIELPSRDGRAAPGDKNTE
jgi:DNA-binding NtrC family response regulator